MGKVWLPGDSDFALAMREPNLLIPKQKSISHVEINRANPISNGLIGAIYATSVADKRIYDPVTNTFREYQLGGDVNVVSTRYGMAHGSANIGSSREIDPIGSASNVGSFLSVSSHTAYGYDCMGMESATQFWLDTQSSPNRLRVACFSGSAVFYGPTEISDDRLIVVAGSTAGANSTNVWLNGQQEISNANAARSVQPILFGGLKVGFEYYQRGTEFLYFRAIWNRALSNAELKVLSENPYQILKPSNDTPYLISVPAGGGVPTLSLPGVTGVQATQATPQVTLTF